MNKKIFPLILLSSALLFAACGTSPIRATQLSNQDQKNIWIEEADAGLFYCVPSLGGKDIEPVCFPARRRNQKDIPNPLPALVDASEFKESSKESKELKDFKELKKGSSEPTSAR